MNNYFLNKHIEWMETGKLPHDGLCKSIEKHNNILDLFRPTENEEWEFLSRQGFSFGYWGSGLKIEDENKYSSYTPLRQTIMLFCHEILNQK